MKPVLALFAFFIVAVSAASCAGTPPARQAAANTVGPEALRCREVLLIGSNQLKILCGTDEQWERYERRLAWAAQGWTYRLQGSAYGR